jgi:hypothetical protein
MRLFQTKFCFLVVSFRLDPNSLAMWSCLLCCWQCSISSSHSLICIRLWSIHLELTFLQLSYSSWVFWSQLSIFFSLVGYVEWLLSNIHTHTHTHTHTTHTTHTFFIRSLWNSYVSLLLWLLCVFLFCFVLTRVFLFGIRFSFRCSSPWNDWKWLMKEWSSKCTDISDWHLSVVQLLWPLFSSLNCTSSLLSHFILFSYSFRLFVIIHWTNELWCF